MLTFSNAKINIGLHVTSKRRDGFHNLETVFYPIGLSDIIEFLPSDKDSFTNTGLPIDCAPEDNLITKAYHLIKKHFTLPPVQVHLYKNIPFGAGLGGGSSNAAYMLKGLVDYFNLSIPKEELSNIAEELGSDCPFFLHNKPTFAYSKGEKFESIQLDLSKYYFAIVKPDFHIPTKLAFSRIKPAKAKIDLKDAIKEPIESWKELIENDFEKSISNPYPEIAKIKESLYSHGAIFALMSGSGSAVYGIFKQPIEIEKLFPSNYFCWMETKKKG